MIEHNSLSFPCYHHGVTMIRWLICRTNVEIELPRHALVTRSCESVRGVGVGKWVNERRAVSFSRQKMLLSLGSEHWPFSGHSQATISISMPCFLLKGWLEPARLNLTCFQHCINNTLFKSKAVERKKRCFCRYQDAKKSFVFSWVIDWILNITGGNSVENEGKMKGGHEGGSSGVEVSVHILRRTPWGLIFALPPHNHLLLTSDLIPRRFTPSAGLRGRAARS